MREENIERVQLLKVDVEGERILFFCFFVF
jgi:hypothetical protein